MIFVVNIFFGKVDFYWFPIFYHLSFYQQRTLDNFYINNNKTITYSDLGHLNKVAVLIFHHQVDDENDSLNIDFLIEKYTESIHKGEVSPGIIIHLFDKFTLVVGKGELQTFGNWFDRERKIFPLKDPKHIDSIRLSYGMNTLREYAEMKNLILPDNYE